MTEANTKELETRIFELGEMVQRESLFLIGISAPTQNSKELSGEGIIPRLWQQFLGEGLLAKIPNRINQGQIIAAYHAIECDDKGPYSFFLGTAVSSLNQIPQGMIGLRVPEGSYLELTTERGSFKSIGLAAWQRIWASQTIRENRRFQVDLEIYDPTEMDPENSQFKIYVGMKVGG